MLKDSIPALLFFTIGLSFNTQVQSNLPPKAENLFKIFIEKTGGQQAYDKIQNRLTKSKMTISIPPIAEEVTSYKFGASF